MGTYLYLFFGISGYKGKKYSNRSVGVYLSPLLFFLQLRLCMDTDFLRDDDSICGSIITHSAPICLFFPAVVFGQVS